MVSGDKNATNIEQSLPCKILTAKSRHVKVKHMCPYVTTEKNSIIQLERLSNSLKNYSKNPVLSAAMYVQSQISQRVSEREI